MNAQEYKKKVQSILELLRKTTVLQHSVSYGNVGAWKEKDVEAAMAHATYCQNLAKEITEKPGFERTKADLNDGLAKISAGFACPFPYKLSMESICHAPEHLMEALMYNQTFDNNLDEKLLAVVRSSAAIPLGHPVLAEFKKIRKLLFDAHRAFTKLTLAFNSKLSTESDVHKCGQFQLEQLSKLVGAAPASGGQFMEIRVFQLLNQWAQFPKGWQVLIQTMCLDLGTLQVNMRAGMRMLLSLMFTWIKMQYCTYGLKCGLLEVTPEALAELSSFNSCFGDWFIEALGLMGDHYNSHLLQSNPALWHRLVHSPTCLLGDEECPEVALLTRRLYLLFLKGGNTLTETANMIIDKHMESGRTIWNSIGVSLYKML